MGIKGARAVSKTELEIEYEDGATLHLYFDASGRFEDAALKGQTMELADLVEEARERNDPARLVSAVLAHLRPL
jgi:metal-responsive CopG/Arc/MetJ family transcriptional regulator